MTIKEKIYFERDRMIFQGFILKGSGEVEFKLNGNKESSSLYIGDLNDVVDNSHYIHDKVAYEHRVKSFGSAIIWDYTLRSNYHENKTPFDKFTDIGAIMYFDTPDGAKRTLDWFLQLSEENKIRRVMEKLANG